MPKGPRVADQGGPPDEAKDRMPQCAHRGRKGIVLVVKAPELLDEWDTLLNGGAGEEIAAGSNTRVWWRCRVNRTHLWRAMVHQRAYQGTGCPYCAGKLPTPDRNLAVCFPDAAAEWHPTRNGDVSPTDVTPGAARVSWWRCAAGHEWEAAVDNRTAGKTGCPYCAGKLASPDRNLAVCHPDIAAEWHPTRNGDLRPEHLPPASVTTVWWRCRDGHEWEVPVATRTGTNNGCPSCAGRFPTPERNLAVLHPELAAQWHPTRNGVVSPTEVAAHSDRKVWWRCEAGHEWEAIIKNRTVAKTPCPYCPRQWATPEWNLAVLYPDLAAEWHPTRNGDLRPERLTPASPTKVWWRCSQGHEWETLVSTRTYDKTGCPYCVGRRATPERNLAVCFPEVAAQWHPRWNYDLRPEQFTPQSNVEVWWCCPRGHEWLGAIRDSTRPEIACPTCDQLTRDLDRWMGRR
jgi:hypothetical protein